MQYAGSNPATSTIRIHNKIHKNISNRTEKNSAVFYCKINIWRNAYYKDMIIKYYQYIQEAESAEGNWND